MIRCTLVSRWRASNVLAAIGNLGEERDSKTSFRWIHGCTRERKMPKTVSGCNLGTFKTRAAAEKHERADIRLLTSSPRLGIAAVNPVRRCSWARTPLGIAYHDADVGRPCARRQDFVRISYARRGTGWSELGNHSEEARGLSRRLPGLRSRACGTVHTSAGRAASSERGDCSQSAQDRRVRSGTRAHSSLFRRSSAASMPTSGASLRELLWTTADVRWKGLPARTAESDALSRDLLRRGFKFVGSTICYAFMQGGRTCQRSHD